MTTIPFNRDTFASEMKPKLSGSNVTLEFDNIESTLVKVGVEVAELIGVKVYEKICAGTAATESEELNNKSKDYLQRAMLHFAVYQHTIFLIARIGNDGITVKKNDDETTIFKYQQDELTNKLISDGWFWMNQLIKLLRENAEKFPDWKDSDEAKNFNELPITTADFHKWVGVNSEYFMLLAMWIIREVWTDCVLSRSEKPKKTDTLTRAVCYEVMARACYRLAYYALPEPIRVDINNEMGKNHAAQSEVYIREKISLQFQSKADAYWVAVDMELAKNASQETESRASKQVYVPKSYSENDKFVAN